MISDSKDKRRKGEEKLYLQKLKENPDPFKYNRKKEGKGIEG